MSTVAAYREMKPPEGFTTDYIVEEAGLGWLWLDWHLLKWLPITADPEQEPNAYTRGWLMGFLNAGGRLCKPIEVSE